jgi:hypothetical protein
MNDRGPPRQGSIARQTGRKDLLVSPHRPRDIVLEGDVQPHVAFDIVSQLSYETHKSSIAGRFVHGHMKDSV